ncbi:hypothetical protein [Alicyclobacillus macrosporangiidus]|uniref:Orotate phosphoribosyltransferase n=1 Tax=Alicyclobacillus macrosporangiidus TaxID=392015 RepID=A0A1I7JKW6_9BACL|nr:hypothetical protein [Alicyclobacillus macrosporangiidus]SFU85829.1 orotate phosphoribosyltransferase [Alicyclobacillus macrosporangiidus]
MDANATQRQLLSLLVRSEAIRVRKTPIDLPFWYTSGKPGPFYIHVERLAGDHVAGTLSRINQVLASTAEASERSPQIREIVLSAYRSDAGYQEAISLLSAAFTRMFPDLPAAISGGERRDWFFSIPLAQTLSIPHVYLYKNGTVWPDQPSMLQPRAKPVHVLHVADILNTGSSYVNHWLPALTAAGMTCEDTFTVAVRGQEGKNRLEERGVRVHTPLVMDESVFRDAEAEGLISSFALADVLQYFESPQAWTRQLLATCGEHILQREPELDTVQRSRLRTFVETDPYGLAAEFPAFFRRAREVLAVQS